MPSFNSEKTISDAIESVISQTYQNWELIIVDDCSVDLTYKIINIYSQLDKRIKVIKNNKNYGPAYCRDKAISISTGYYICFLDSDDLYYKDKLLTQIKFMISNGCSISYHYYDVINYNSKILHVENKSIKFLNYSNNHYERGLGYCLTFMIRKDIIGDTLFMNCNIKIAEDYFYFASILKEHTAALCPIVLAAYRKSLNSRSSNKIKAALNILKVYVFLEKNPIHISIYYWIIYILKSLKRKINE
jgi:teichuronic acid biosynthesis glycosyltransferase TuaG